MKSRSFSYNSNVLSRCIKILPKSDRKKIPAIIILQVFLALVDLIAVAIVGVIAAISISGIQSTVTNYRITKVLQFFGMEHLSLQIQASVLGLVAATLLISRTIASVFITRKTLMFLGRRGAFIASDIFSRLTSQSLIKLRVYSSQDVIYSITSGASAITLGIVGAFLSTFADGIVAIVMIVGLFVLNPIMAIGMMLFFGLTAALLYKLMSGQSHQLGSLQADQAISVNETITEVLSSYRELLVRNRRDYYSRKLTTNRIEAAEVSVRLQFLPNISKYIIEIMIVLGALLVSSFQFIAQDATSAIAVLSVFLASAARIAPAIMRIQQGAISIKGAAGGAERTLDMIEDLKNISNLPKSSDFPIFNHPNFSPTVSLENLSFAYSGSSTQTLSEINLQIKSGDLVAIVGPSGAGKTTLIDLILGVIDPDIGTVHISGHTPSDAVSKWPGAISYVPQDILISNGTIAENVAFGFPVENVPEESIKNALIFAELREFIGSLNNKTQTNVGERGTKISGGQRQRLGIARALLTHPKLLVLDEATSTLDAQTELAISHSINKLKGAATVVMIAHRLSTVSNADLVVYMDKGTIKASGTLEEVRVAVPDFDTQAKLMGL